MRTSSITASGVVALAALIDLVAAHGAFFGAGAFGTTLGRDDLSFPLNSGTPKDKILFRGLTPDTAGGTVTLKAGGTVDLGIGCSRSSVQAGKACQEDAGSLHSSDGKRTGCGLAISYKDFKDIKSSDLVVFSSLHDCIHNDAKHTFKIPKNLPATPKGKVATCAFGWIPSATDAADEMYMTGFNCEVQSSTPFGTKIVNAAKLPFLFFAVQDPLAAKERPSWAAKYSNGAQTLVVDGAASSSNSNSTSSSTKARTAKKQTKKASSACSASNAETKTKSRKSVVKRQHRAAGPRRLSEDAHA